MGKVEGSNTSNQCPSKCQEFREMPVSSHCQSKDKNEQEKYNTHCQYRLYSLVDSFGSGFGLAYAIAGRAGKTKI
ncbi:hypothetical protein [Microbulbifer mangrovi]|uniref:hypothetical protein n=1 Tax=Microbulbifer mangrovi TaxID=927787 RepID=UPI0013017737|nr:hypothetical protein [Microbulbifer mangrovi]